MTRAPAKDAPLLVAPCSGEAASYACRNWHYAKKLPAGKHVRFGVWERGDFKGCVIFSSSACPWLGTSFGLSQLEACELVRVALHRSHAAPVTRIVAIAIRLLRANSPKLRLLVSYADPEQGHHGGIYQGGNWIFVGSSAKVWTANGLHNRTFGANLEEARRRLGPNVRIEWHEGKHKFLFPLDERVRALCEKQRKPAPKRGKPLDESARLDEEATEV